jgi:hypothetical protein
MEGSLQLIISPFLINFTLYTGGMTNGLHNYQFCNQYEHETEQDLI